MFVYLKVLKIAFTKFVCYGSNTVGKKSTGQAKDKKEGKLLS
jgi:hypothetical protein